MFKYLFKIYKLRQLVKMRERVDLSYRARIQLADECYKRGDMNSFNYHYDAYRQKEEELKKLDNQIKLYE